MSVNFMEMLFEKGLISRDSRDKAEQCYARQVISLHYDLRVLLYAGIVLLSTGLSILLYKNLAYITDTLIITLMSIACLVCYAVCLKKQPPFTRKKVENASLLADYLLLLASLLLLSIIGYVQYRFGIFGQRWRLATFIPMVIFFFTAYFFDHQGVLSMAITNLAAWLGLAINEKKWYLSGAYNQPVTIYTAILLGVVLILLANLVKKSDFKRHFHALYHQFGTHIFFIATLIALFYFYPAFVSWFLLLAAGVAWHLRKALHEHLFYYLVTAVLYAYIGISYLAVQGMEEMFKRGGFLPNNIVSLYFFASASFTAWLLIRLNRKIKRDAGL